MGPSAGHITRPGITNQRQGPVSCPTDISSQPGIEFFHLSERSKIPAPDIASLLPKKPKKWV